MPHEDRVCGVSTTAFRSSHLLTMISTTEQEAFLSGCAFICEMRKALEAAGVSGESPAVLCTGKAAQHSSFGCDSNSRAQESKF